MAPTRAAWPTVFLLPVQPADLFLAARRSLAAKLGEPPYLLPEEPCDLPGPAPHLQSTRSRKPIPRLPANSSAWSSAHTGPAAQRWAWEVVRPVQPAGCTRRAGASHFPARAPEHCSVLARRMPQKTSPDKPRPTANRFSLDTSVLHLLIAQLDQ